MNSVKLQPKTETTMETTGEPSTPNPDTPPPTWLEVSLIASVWFATTRGRDGHEVVGKALS